MLRPFFVASFPVLSPVPRFPPPVFLQHVLVHIEFCLLPDGGYDDAEDEVEMFMSSERAYEVYLVGKFLCRVE